MEDDIEEKNRIHFTKEEYNRILEICRNPPVLTEHMIETAKRYKKRGYYGH